MNFRRIHIPLFKIGDLVVSNQYAYWIIIEIHDNTYQCQLLGGHHISSFSHNELTFVSPTLENTVKNITKKHPNFRQLEKVKNDTC